LRSPRPVLKNLPFLAVIYKAWLWRINKVKLYRPATGEQDAWPGLAPALTRPIRWDRVAEQYDQMVKYATAIRTGTASTEAILRRFMKANAAHPTYQAMIELGRAQKTIFLARYLRSRALQREIHEGFNVVESWNRANRSSSTARAAT
jgi:TnpA family transposase